MVKFNLPIRPFSPIDALNRRSASQGSISYAQGAAHADYNGHRVIVEWNDYKRHYAAHYMWAGIRWLARGSFRECLQSAIAEYDRGALGASVEVTVRAEDADQVRELFPCLLEGELTRADACEWYTWRHATAGRCARDSASRTPTLMFDWALMQQVQTEAEYVEALRAKYGHGWLR